MKNSQCLRCTMPSLFYLAVPSVFSRQNSYSNCYNATQGAVYSLKSTSFVEDSSTFSFLSAKTGGIFYIHESIINLKNLSLNSTLAFEGSIAFLADTPLRSYISFESSNISYVEAIWNGGVIHLRQTNNLSSQASYVFFSGQIRLSHVFSNLGGLAYFDSKYAMINFAGTMSLENLQSNRTAAFLYYKSDTNLIVRNINSKSAICKTDGCLIFSENSSANVTLQNMTLTGYSSAFSPRIYLGKQIQYYTDFDMAKILIENSQYFADTVDLSPFLGAAFYFSGNTLIISIQNSFSLHTSCLNSSIFYLKDIANFTDSRSLFSTNEGAMGGVMHSSATQSIVFQTTSFQSNYAIYGGALFISRSTTVIFNALNTKGNIAFQSGGFMFNIDQEASSYFIVQTSIRRNLENMLPQDAEYLIHEQNQFERGQSNRDIRILYGTRNGTTIAFLNGAQIQECSAKKGQGGLIYSEDSQMSLHFNGSVNTVNVYSNFGDGGGVIHMKTGKDLIAWGNLFFRNYLYGGNMLGSLIYAKDIKQLYLVNNTIRKNTGTSTSISYLPASLFDPLYMVGFQYYQQQNVAGVMIAVQGKTNIISQNNLFENIYYSFNTGVFDIRNGANFSDSNSTYRNNQAWNASALYFEKAGFISITGSVFQSCTSKNFGLILVDRAEGDISLANLLITNSRGLVGSGGLIKIIDTDKITPYSTKTIVRLYVQNISASVMIQANTGGFIQLEQSSMDVFISNISVKGLQSSQGLLLYLSNTNSSRGLSNITLQSFTHDCDQVNWINRSTLYTVQQSELIYASGFNFKASNLSIRNCHKLANSSFISAMNSITFEVSDMSFYQLSSSGSGVFNLESIDQIKFQNLSFERIDLLNSGIFTVKQKFQNLQIKNLTISEINITNGSGGVLYVQDNRAFEESNSIATVQLSELLIAKVSAQRNGGLFYIDSPFIQSFTLDKINATDIQAFSGGIFYIQDMRNELVLQSLGSINGKNQQQQQNIYSSIKVQGDGIFLYSKAKEISYVAQNLEVKCQDASSSNITDLYSKSYQENSVIYIENNSKNLTIVNSSFSNCQKSSRGGVYTLISTNLYEVSCSYSDNYGRLGGVYYMQNTNFTMQGSQYEKMNADEGGILFTDAKTNGVMTNLKVKSSFAQRRGGFISSVYNSIQQSESSQIMINGQDSMYLNISSNLGGLVYSSNPRLTLQIRNISAIQNISSENLGGVFYITELQKLSISDSTIREFDSPVGSFIYSQSQKLIVEASSSNLSCWDSDQFEHVQSLNYSTHSPIYVENAQSVSLSTVSISNCYSSTYGSTIFVRNTYLALNQFTAVNNIGFNGGVIRALSSNVQIVLSIFQDNIAIQGGAIFVSQKGLLTILESQFRGNHASIKAGVINIDSDSSSVIQSSTFTENHSAEDTSVIDALGIGSIVLRNVSIKNNYSKRNTLRFIYATAIIEDCQFRDNTAMEQSENIIVGFSSIKIYNSTFFNSERFRDNLQLEKIYGSFLQVLQEVDAILNNCSFVNGNAQKGGSLYIYGLSNIVLSQSKFTENTALTEGGAIYGEDFIYLELNSVEMISNTAFGLQGDDIYVSGQLAQVLILDSYFTNSGGTQSLFSKYVNLKLSKSSFMSRGHGNELQNGAGLQCISCSAISFQNNSFSHLAGLQGGAVYLEGSNSDSQQYLSNDATLEQKYLINNTVFLNCTSLTGGSLYALDIQNLSIGLSIFENSSSKMQIKEYDSEDIDVVGSGGSIYFSCTETNDRCSMIINNGTQFLNSTADLQGGAIYWDEIEPQIDNSVLFTSNKAQLYGADIACFGQQVVSIDNDTLYQQEKKINENYLKRLRSLQQTQQNSFEINEARSGGTLDQINLAIIDKYGQIVTTDSYSKVLIFVNSTFNTAESANLYPPVIEGKNQFITSYGIFQIEGIVFDGTPGQSYEVVVQVNSLDSTKSSNRQFMQISNITTLDYKLKINLRDCNIGEQFTEAGRCQLCESSFSLVQQTSPGSCQECPTDKAQCPGGSQLWPYPGFWRSSLSSPNIYKCENENACLGISDENSALEDQCAQGYQGVLCNDCAENFSRSGTFKCAQCPTELANAFRLFFIALGVILLVVIMIYSSISGAKDSSNLTSIYMKIMVNHFQLLMMISVFDINWSKQISTFLNHSQEVSTVYTQIFSFDCFINRNQSLLKSNDETFDMRIHYIKLIILASLPLLLILVCICFGLLYQKIKERALSKMMKTKRVDFYSLTTASVVAALFLVHPSIVQYMFQNFRCKDIEGESRLLNDMEIVCWQDKHVLLSLSLALPSILIWGLGIPFYALVKMINHRHDLDNLKVKKQFGFLYKGFKKKFFFWEIINMYRKIIVIAIAVFLKNQGILIQTLIVLVVVFMQACINLTLFYSFFQLNLQLQPYIDKRLSQLETLSLLVSILTFYIGIFFIVNKSKAESLSQDGSQDYQISLNDQLLILLYSLILIINLTFFVQWLRCIIQQLRLKLRDNLPKLYIQVFLCKNQQRYQKEIEEHQKFLMNQKNLERFNQLLDSVQNMIENGELYLDDHSLKHLEDYFSEERILQLGKKRIDQLQDDSFLQVLKNSTLKNIKSQKNKGKGKKIATPEEKNKKSKRPMLNNKKTKEKSKMIEKSSGISFKEESKVQKTRIKMQDESIEEIKQKSQMEHKIKKKRNKSEKLIRQRESSMTQQKLHQDILAFDVSQLKKKSAHTPILNSKADSKLEKSGRSKTKNSSQKEQSDYIKRKIRTPDSQLNKNKELQNDREDKKVIGVKVNYLSQIKIDYQQTRQVEANLQTPTERIQNQSNFESENLTQRKNPQDC